MDAPLASVPVSQCGGDLALWTPLTKVSTIYWTSVMHQIVSDMAWLMWSSQLPQREILLSHFTVGGFPGGATVKSLPANAGDTRDVRSIPGLGRFPLYHSCQENPKERGTLRAYSPGCHSQTWLSDWVLTPMTCWCTKSVLYVWKSNSESLGTSYTDYPWPASSA